MLSEQALKRLSRPNQWYADIVCECGHKGLLHRDPPDRENIPWHFYVTGFESKHHAFDWDPKAEVADLLARINPECPNCGRTGTVRNA